MSVFWRFNTISIGNYMALVADMVLNLQHSLPFANCKSSMFSNNVRNYVNKVCAKL